MSTRNKYSLIGKRLSDSGLERVRLTFEELNDLCSLPSTAYSDRTFWANTWRSFRAQGWLEVGYVVDEVSLGNYVEFHHDPKRAQHPGAGRKNSFPKQVETAKRSSRRGRIKVEVEIPRPCPAEVERYLQEWESLEGYPAQEAALDDLFFKYCPSNKMLSDILLKAAALNTFYSTNIFSVTPVAQHILELDIDDRLKAGDLTLVEDISKVELRDEVKNFYSFATKYCSHHNPLAFPIYDSYVSKVLRYFRDKDAFFYFEDYELKNYLKFQKILIQFQTTYGLEDYNVKEIDRYLWQIGRKYFPRQYKKRK